MSTVVNDIEFDVVESKDLDNGKKYHVGISIPDTGWVNSMEFNVEKGNETSFYPLHYVKNEDGRIYFESDIDLDTRAIYRYYFTYLVNNQMNYVKKNGAGNTGITRDDMWKMSVNFDTPDWAKGRMMYHIFVDRFRRGNPEEMPVMPRRFIHKDFDEDMIIGPDKDGIWNNDFYGGDLEGIEESLDYIKSLGIDILYLSPIVWSQSNHRYDTADYENVDPYAGTNENLKQLCDKAHSMGMKVVLDSVFNHTGNDSKYFNEYGTFDTDGAYNNDSSVYSSFYRKHYDNGKVYYDHWWGMPNLPVCDGNSESWKNYITGEGGVIDKWFDLGIDGLRLDVADELTDEYIELIRKAVHRNKSDGLILGEVWKNPMRMNRGYIESGKGMDSVMNYSMVDALIRYFKYADCNKLNYTINDIKNEYPEGTINTLMNFTSTHDISRAINIFSTYDFQEYGEWAWNPTRDDLEWCSKYNLTSEQYEHGKDVYESYIWALAFMPGILSIFYGDEVGIQGMGNLMNRKPFPWGKEDMDLVNYFREIGSIRKTEEFLHEAGINIKDINNYILTFERESDDKKALVSVNRCDYENWYDVPKEYEEPSKVYTLKKSTPGKLAPFGGVALIKEK